MDRSADMIRVLATRASDFTEADQLLGAMAVTLPKGDAALDPKKMSEASNFPLANKMSVALTRNRMVVYKTGWGDKVGNPLGDVPLNRVNNIEITWNKKLAVVMVDFHDAPPVIMISTNPESAEHLRHAFLQLRGRI